MLSTDTVSVREGELGRQSKEFNLGLMEFQEVRGHPNRNVRQAGGNSGSKTAELAGVIGVDVILQAMEFDVVTPRL